MMISELDKVTTVKVYNWFANRRKDDKRRRHIGKLTKFSYIYPIIKHDGVRLFLYKVQRFLQ